jgi:hypothetical protein
MEPYKLKRWQLPAMPPTVKFYTCARPGRSKGSQAKVPDNLVHEWVNGLPGHDNIIVVSLLGQKRGGKNEWSFYSFNDHHQTFQQWLDIHYKSRHIQVLEHQTVDEEDIPTKTLEAASSDIIAHLK